MASSSELLEVLTRQQEALQFCISKLKVLSETEDRVKSTSHGQQFAQIQESLKVSKEILDSLTKSTQSVPSVMSPKLFSFAKGANDSEDMKGGSHQGFSFLPPLVHQSSECSHENQSLGHVRFSNSSNEQVANGSLLSVSSDQIETKKLSLSKMESKGNADVLYEDVVQLKLAPKESGYFSREASIPIELSRTETLSPSLIINLSTTTSTIEPEDDIFEDVFALKATSQYEELNSISKFREGSITNPRWISTSPCFNVQNFSKKDQTQIVYFVNLSELSLAGAFLPVSISGGKWYFEVEVQNYKALLGQTNPPRFAVGWKIVSDEKHDFLGISEDRIIRGHECFGMSMNSQEVESSGRIGCSVDFPGKVVSFWTEASRPHGMVNFSGKNCKLMPLLISDHSCRFSFFFHPTQWKIPQETLQFGFPLLEVSVSPAPLVKELKDLPMRIYPSNFDKKDPVPFEEIVLLCSPTNPLLKRLHETVTSFLVTREYCLISAPSFLGSLPYIQEHH
jgi:hypothetical protein